MVFLHGTAIMHKGGLGKTPAERGQQVEQNEPSVSQFEEYVPVDKADEKLRLWAQQGAEIIYLSSHQNSHDIEKDKEVLRKYHFPNGPIVSRQGNKTYADIAEAVMPNILIEDDCKSIGGEIEMTYPHISTEKKQHIKSIVVPEFSGIDHLPSNIEDLNNK